MLPKGPVGDWLEILKCDKSGINRANICDPYFE